MTNTTILLPSSYPRNYQIPGFKDYFQQQRQTNWCWIATAVSVANFYNKNPNTWNQCVVYDKSVDARARDNRSACTFDTKANIGKLPSNDACNQTGYPKASMDAVGIYVRHGKFGSPGYVYNDVKTLVDNDQPPIIGLNFTTERASWKHVVVVFGYTVDGKWWIADPLKPNVLCYSTDELQNKGIYAAELFVSGPKV
ncbi:C39 family peptidase [Yersinia sp. Marseille-Q3913]|uniref:C39 family peptidase n=1 Tax=Yersinia sp. Marseille-Q3913 TaxID=2830769 RepID=UPI001BAECB5B|nr:C39 family peptidase [Yersinia sp. Marseille-Q3913]MBS0057667.1 C39 family peptidase [Yersinia sp. Marseille-Q3913]